MKQVMVMLALYVPVRVLLWVLWRVLESWRLKRSGSRAGVRIHGRIVPYEELVQLTLEPYREALEATRRPVAYIDLEAFPGDELLVSKLGGRAWWPLDQAPPASEDGDPLVLLAQVNFAEVPAMLGWPDQGLLQFFIAANKHYGANLEDRADVEALTRQRNFRVVYWADLSVAAQALPVRQASGADLPHDPAHPRRMRFRAGTQTLTGSHYRFDSLFGGDAFETLKRRAKESGFPEETPHVVYAHLAGEENKLGGYPFFHQGDPRKDGPMELLLQLCTDYDLEMMWMADGVAGFFIDPADLARADFSRVMYYWDWD